MTINELYEWIVNPSMLTRTSLSEIKQLIDEYPYFQAARMLYLKNLALVEDVRFQKELKRMSVYISDRKRLYMLIKSDQEGRTEEELNRRRTEEQGNGIVKDEAIRFSREQKTAETKIKQETKNQYITIAPTDYISWLETNAEDIVLPESEDNRLKHQDIIDSFIKSDGRLPFNRPENEAKKSEDDREGLETFEKNTLDDSYFTETLARVYFSQKRYDKALEIIRALNLKYPEKNVYFADQIQYLEKIINIKK
jgi:predicted Zn-dependent protease